MARIEGLARGLKRRARSLKRSLKRLERRADPLKRSAERLKNRGWKLRFGLTARYGSSRGDAELPPATVILMSYRRPQNLAAIVGQLLRLRFVERVVLSNNNPDVRMRDWVHQQDERLIVIDQPLRHFASYRMHLARTHPADHYISIDDDIFLEPRQVEDLYLRYLDEPGVAHGIKGGRRTPAGERGPFDDNLRGDTPVDVIHRVYVFSSAHVEEWFRNLYMLGIAEADGLRYGEDILLSFAGAGRPRCHDVGTWLDCETSSTPGIALWREDGFVERRREVYDRLSARKPR